MNIPSDRKPLDCLKRNKPIFKLISPGKEYFEHIQTDVSRSGFHPHLPQHYIQQQRANSANPRRKTESPAAYLSPVRPATAAAAVHISVISLDAGNAVTSDERPKSSNNFFSTTKVRQVQLPQAGAGTRCMVRSAGYRSISVCSERYLSSSPSQSLTSRKGESEQARRFEEEWANREKSRLLRRMSQKPDYRIDRLYYINGVSYLPRNKKPNNEDREIHKRLKYITNGSVPRQLSYACDDDYTSPRTPRKLCENVLQSRMVSSEEENTFLTQRTMDVTSSEHLLQSKPQVVHEECLDDASSDDDSIDEIPDVIHRSGPDGSPRFASQSEWNGDVSDQSQTCKYVTDVEASTVTINENTIADNNNADESRNETNLLAENESKSNIRLDENKETPSNEIVICNNLAKIDLEGSR